MWLERISGGGVNLIDMQDAKDYLRLLEDDFDAEVANAISAASHHLDVDEDGFGGLGFPIVSQQWSSKAAEFGPTVRRLPFARVTSVDEIRYTEPDGVTEIMSPDHYTLTRRGRSSVVTLTGQRWWPNLMDRPDAVEIRFTAGFVDVEAVPDDIKAAARLLIGHFFRNRSAAEAGQVPVEIALGVDALTARYRRFAA